MERCPPLNFLTDDSSKGAYGALLVLRFGRFLNFLAFPPLLP